MTMWCVILVVGALESGKPLPCFEHREQCRYAAVQYRPIDGAYCRERRIR